jgi:hypothetical protein
MTSATVQLVDRYRALPRALQWGVLTVIGVAAFLLWDATIRPLTDDLDRQAASIEADVARIRAGESIAEDFNKVARVVECLGPVAKPGGQADGAAELIGIVNNVRAKHAISNDNFDFRPQGKVPGAGLTSMTGGKRLEKLVGDLRFTATTEDAMAVIAELESSPEIESIKSLRVTKDANRKVKVNLSLESWILPSETTKGGVS